MLQHCEHNPIYHGGYEAGCGRKLGQLYLCLVRQTCCGLWRESVITGVLDFCNTPGEKRCVVYDLVIYSKTRIENVLMLFICCWTFL